MILLDVDDRQSTDKADDRFYGSTVRQPERAAGNSHRGSEVWSLPDYDTSEQQHRGQQQQPPPKKQPPRFQLNATFWRASLFALFVYVVLSIAVAIPVVTKLKAKQREAQSAIPPLSSLWTEVDRNDGQNLNFKWTAPWEWKDAHNLECEEFTSAEYFHPNITNGTHSVVSAQYELPPVGLITVRSNFSYSALTPLNAFGGNFTVDISSDEAQKTILFSVSVNATSNRVRENTHLCFNRVGSSRGLTIFSPDSYNITEQLSFDVRLVLPQHANIPTFVTYLPQFQQNFGDLMGQVTLTEVVVEGADAPITFQSIGAYSLSIKNILAPIEGNFNVTSDLSLDVIDGAIGGNVTLSNNANSPSKRPTRLSIANGESDIKLNVTLASPSLPSHHDSKAPSFATQVQSFRGFVDLSISHDRDMEPAALTLQVQNALAPTSVRLDSKFQGRFDVLTRQSTVGVQNGGRPQVAGRVGIFDNRTVSYDRYFADRIVGWVGWDPQPTTVAEYERTIWGSWEIRSSIYPVIFHLA